MLLCAGDGDVGGGGDGFCVHCYARAFAECEMSFKRMNVVVVVVVGAVEVEFR